MTRIAVRVLRDSLGEILALVARGQIVTITRRGRPIAEIHPVGTAGRLAKGAM